MSNENSAQDEYSRDGEDDDNRIIFLRSRDNQVFDIPISAARISELVKTSIECDDDFDEENPVELINVGSSCLEKVIEFLKHYAEDPMIAIKTPLEGNTLEEIVSPGWYRNFVSGVELSMIFELVTASNYMEIQPLLDLTCLVVSIGLMGKSAEEIRVMLNIPKLTPEEEQKARKEHRWIFED